MDPDDSPQLKYRVQLETRNQEALYKAQATIQKQMEQAQFKETLKDPKGLRQIFKVDDTQIKEQEKKLFKRAILMHQRQFDMSQFK